MVAMVAFVVYLKRVVVVALVGECGGGGFGLITGHGSSLCCTYGQGGVVDKDGGGGFDNDKGGDGSS